MTDPDPPDDLIMRTIGPYTLRCCITAACTRCGTSPQDEDTGIAPHFDSPGQATHELTRDWGWTLTATTDRAEHLELLCPACAAGGNHAENRVPVAPDPGDSTDPERPWWEDPAQPRPEMPPNAAVYPTPAKEPEDGPMPRLMAVSLTEDHVRQQAKAVTRRVGWLMLRPSDQLTLCRKVMGRRPTHRGCSVATMIAPIAWRYLDEPAEVNGGTRERTK